MYDKGRFSRHDGSVTYREHHVKKDVLSGLADLHMDDVEQQSNQNIDLIDIFSDLFNVKNSIIHAILSMIIGMFLGGFIVSVYG
uniref:Magnesium transporter n=1 Tax=Strongyloides stercoralis TaxID=6248 RepID=A0A0K0E568_STRER